MILDWASPFKDRLANPNVGYDEDTLSGSDISGSGTRYALHRK